MKETNDLRAENIIALASSFEELFRNIKNHQIEITGSDGKTYNTDELITIIDKVRHGELDIDYITRKYGLREKVYELMKIEALRQEIKDKE